MGSGAWCLGHQLRRLTYMRSGATLTIENANIDAEGQWGIVGYPDGEILIIKNSDVKAALICEQGSDTPPSQRQVMALWIALLFSV